MSNTLIGSPGMSASHVDEVIPERHAPVRTVAEQVEDAARNTPIGFALDFLDSYERILANRSDGNWSAVNRRKEEVDDLLREYAIVQNREADEGRKVATDVAEVFESKIAQRRLAFTEAQASMKVDASLLATGRGYKIDAIPYLAANPKLKTVVRKAPADPRKVLMEAPAIEASYRADIAAVKSLLGPMGDALATALGNLERARGGSGMPAVNPDNTLAWPLLAVDATGNTRVTAIPNPLEFFLSDESTYRRVRADIERQIEERYRGVTDTAGPEEKRQRIASINAKILDLHRDEVAAVKSLRAAGEFVPLRAGLDIRAILGVDGPPPGKRR